MITSACSGRIDPFHETDTYILLSYAEINISRGNIIDFNFLCSGRNASLNYLLLELSVASGGEVTSD